MNTRTRRAKRWKFLKRNVVLTFLLYVTVGRLPAMERSPTFGRGIRSADEKWWRWLGVSAAGRHPADTHSAAYTRGNKQAVRGQRSAIDTRSESHGEAAAIQQHRPNGVIVSESDLTPAVGRRRPDGVKSPMDDVDSGYVKGKGCQHGYTDGRRSIGENGKEQKKNARHHSHATSSRRTHQLAPSPPANSHSRPKAPPART